MRSRTFTESPKRRHQFPAFAGSSISTEWHARAPREAGTVRRLLRRAHIGGRGVLGETHTIDALEHDSISELLLTPRFVELNPGVSLRAAQLADAQGVRTMMITGLAALELDLAANGIGAVLRRPRAPSLSSPPSRF